MIKNRLILFLFGLLFLSSCVKEGELNSTERRIVGTWYYETVIFSDGWGSELITNQFHSIYLQFNSDFSFIYSDDVTGTTGTGVWDVVDSYNGDNSSNQIFISLTDDESGELSQIVFENISVTRKRMSATYQDHKTYYHYDLMKI